VRTKSVINSIGILLLAIAVGAGITWMIFDRSQDDAVLTTGFDGDDTVVVSVEQAGTAMPPVGDNASDATIVPESSDQDASVVDQPDPDPVEDPLWDARIRSALTSSDLNLRQKSQQLLDLASVGSGGASVEQRLEALDHGLNLLDDEDYDEDALRLALRSDLPAELGESILIDLHGRDPELLVGTCQKIAALQNHPLREEAEEIVSFLAPELVEEATN
jgi:hypothetical protein